MRISPAYTYTTCMPGALRGQKRILNLLELELQIDGCELPSRCWEPNSGPLQEQQERMDMYILAVYNEQKEKPSTCLATGMTILILNMC